MKRIFTFLDVRLIEAIPVVLFHFVVVIKQDWPVRLVPEHSVNKQEININHQYLLFFIIVQSIYYKIKMSQYGGLISKNRFDFHVINIHTRQKYMHRFLGKKRRHLSHGIGQHFCIAIYFLHKLKIHAQNDNQETFRYVYCFKSTSILSLSVCLLHSQAYAGPSSPSSWLPFCFFFFSYFYFLCAGMCVVVSSKRTKLWF